MIRDNAILVAHDAGGAELLSLWAKENLENAVAVLKGPALSIFKKNFPTIKVLPLSKAMTFPYPVITGTSWQSDLEKKAIKHALFNNKYCCTLLDHWVNYKERLLYKGVQLEPDELWCFDKYALDICQEVFPKVPKKLYINPYFAATRKELESLQIVSKSKSNEGLDILYLSESVDKHSQALYGNSNQLSGYTEREAFDFLLRCLPTIFPTIRSLTVRPHPSQTKSDLSWMNSYDHEYRFSVSSESSLCEQILSHNIIIGLESVALVVAIIANKPVFSAIPPNFKKCAIPYSEITHLSDLVVR